MSNTPSELEIKNAQKVVGFLSDMKGISFKTLREDIFEVNAEGGGSCLVDVEESIVCLSVEVCDVPADDYEAEIDNFLMEQNGKAVHGKFAKTGGKYFFKDNLEFANLDFNELEASLKWCFGMVTSNVQKIANIIKTGEVGDEIDFERDEIDLEDLMETGENLEELMAVGAVMATELFSGSREGVEETEQAVPEIQEERPLSGSDEPDSYDSSFDSDSGSDSSFD